MTTKDIKQFGDEMMRIGYDKGFQEGRTQTLEIQEEEKQQLFQDGFKVGMIEGELKTLEKVLPILKEGCGDDFVLEEQDCICGDDFEYEDKVKVLLCELCLDKIKRIKLLSKLEDDEVKE